MKSSENNEILYNGIKLEGEWPPTNISASREPIQVPYLKMRPAVIPIDLGRQLLVDEFLIYENSMKRKFHVPKLHEANPVLSPETDLEMNFGLCPVACPFTDGVFYDSEDGLFKMWYQAGWFDGTAYATSVDGVKWNRTQLDVESGTNRVLPLRKQIQRDGVGVWYDQDAPNRDERYKMFVFDRVRDPAWKYGEELGGDCE